MNESRKANESMLQNYGDEYQRLPAGIKAMFSRKEWQFMPDSQRNNLVRTETEPEWSFCD